IEKREGDALVAHLVRLGSGLESMLVGEPQILGQLKDALVKAQAQGTASPVLTELFERSIRAASKIRQETGIGRGTVSLGSAAVKIAGGDWTSCRLERPVDRNWTGWDADYESAQCERSWERHGRRSQSAADRILLKDRWWNNNRI